MPIFFDVTIAYLLPQGEPSGGSRCVEGLCAAAEPRGIRPVVFHPGRRTWFQLQRFTSTGSDIPRPRSLLDRSLASWRGLAPRLRHLESHGRLLELGPGDALHLLDARVAVVPRFAASVARLKQRHPTCEVVGLVRDLHPLALPHCYPNGVRHRCRAWLRLLEAHADRIVVGSAAIAEVVRRHLPGRPVRAIHLCSRGDACPTLAPTSVADLVQRLARARSVVPAAGDRLRSQGSWLLSVGRLEMRRNQSLLLDALEPLWRERRLDLPLVLVGGPSNSARGLHARIRASTVLRQNVIPLGAIPDDLLWLVYHHAALAIVPALDAGTGQPVVEALQSGTPCLASRAGAHPEVAGDRVACFDPRSADELRALVVRFLEEPTYADELRNVTTGFRSRTWGDAVADLLGEPCRPVAAWRPPELDVVYTWCDDADPAFRAAIGSYRTAPLAADSAGTARFRTYDELRYSLRSLEQHASWIRNVILVTSGQVPHWLRADRPDVRIVPHRDIFGNPDHLPCFNSLAIEMSLHRIPRLSDWFLYLNDDFLVGNTLAPEAFYSSGGQPLFFVEDYLLPSAKAPWFPGPDEDLMKRCHRYNHALLGRCLPIPLDARDPTHTPQLYGRANLHRLAREWSTEISETQACRFRAPRNTKLAVLYPSFAAESPSADSPCRQRTLYNGSSEYIFKTVRDQDVGDLNRWLAEIEAVRPLFFCVNDAVEDASLAASVRERYRATLDRMFPRPSRWERPLP